MRYTIDFSCVSHTGNRRSMNQDNFICDGRYMKPENGVEPFSLNGSVKPEDGPVLFGVFDGMGGEECGEIASYLAAYTASKWSFGADLIEDLARYCRQANEEICRYTQEHVVDSMGTTAAVLAFDREEIVLCNIGDSRIYRLSKGRMEQISQDHVSISPYGTKPPLSQNLGIPPEELEIEPYLARGEYHGGDRYLICSDGLTDMLSEEEIQTILEHAAPNEAAQALLESALARGGKDNVTILVCQIERERGWPWKRRRNV